MKLTLLSGTNRPGSNTRKICAVVASIYEDLGQPADLMDLAELPPEIFSPGSYAEKPESFLARFGQPILESDGLIVVTPEYNGGMPGVLKYFIDMVKFPESFQGLPVCFIGLAAGMWGALRPVEQLQHIFGHGNACVFPPRVFIPRVNAEIDGTGALRDPNLQDRLKEQAEGFVEFVKRLRR